MTDYKRTVKPGHRVSVRGVPISTGKWVQDPYIALAAGDTATISTDVPPPPPPPVEPPPPTGRPWPAPVTSRTVQAPASGDLGAFVAQQPDGTVIGCPSTGSYTMAIGVRFERKQNIVLRGNGAAINMTGPGDQDNSSAFIVRGSHNIAIENFRVRGNYSGVPALQGENAHLLSLSDWYAQGISSYIEMSGVVADHIRGDFVYANGYTQLGGGAAQPGHHLWVHHNKGDHCGRNAISPINFTDGLVEDNEWDNINYHVYDIEPDFTAQQVRRWTFQRDKIGSYAHRAGLVGFFVRNWNPPGNAPVSDILVDRVTVEGIAANGYNGKPMGINVRFDSPSSNVAITNCSSPIVSASPVMVFNNVTGLRVAENRQGGALLSGSGYAFGNSTGVVTA